MDMPMPNATMPMMQMTFYFGDNVRILFKSWHVTNPGELVGSIIAVFFMAFFYEGLKTLREYLVHLDVKKNKKYKTLYTTTESTPLLKSGTRTLNSPDHRQRGWLTSTILLYLQWLHVLQSVLHVVQTGWGYMLMLVAMTYNGWLFMAVCFGAGVGYLVFARFRYMLSTAPDFREQSEPCH